MSWWSLSLLAQSGHPDPGRLRRAVCLLVLKVLDDELWLTLVLVNLFSTSPLIS